MSIDAEKLARMQVAIKDLMETLVRFGAASSKTGDWGFLSNRDLESYIYLTVKRKLVKKQETKAVIDWHNVIETRTRKEKHSQWYTTINDAYATTTASLSGTCTLTSVSVDEYIEDWDIEEEIITPVLHHQSHLSDPILNSVGTRCTYQNQGAFSLDSS